MIAGLGNGVWGSGGVKGEHKESQCCSLLTRRFPCLRPLLSPALVVSQSPVGVRLELGFEGRLGFG